MAKDEQLFATTRWNVVLQAARTRAPQSAGALEELCRAYWRPLYAYLRRSGNQPADAEDLTQGFLAYLLEHQGLRTVAPVKGKFRSFLLASLKHYLANERDKQQAQKRGGGCVLTALEDPLAERNYAREPVDSFTPEKIYDWHWAFTILDQVRQRLGREYARGSRAERFQVLAGFLPGESNPLPLTDTAARLGVTAGALKVEVHRLRQHYRKLLREAVAQTVTTPDEVDDELRYLIEIVSE